MGETVGSKKILSVRRLVLGLLALAVLGAGCYTALVYERRTELGVAIYDLIETRVAGRVTVLTRGEIYPPFKWYTLTETRACELVGIEVTKFLSGEAPSGTPGVRVTRMEPTQIESHETIAVFLDEFGGEYSSDKEEKFVGCVTAAIRETHPAVRIVPPGEYRQAAFPGLAPEDIKRMGDPFFVDDPGFQGRIAPLGIRYLIRVTGLTRTKKVFG